MNARFLLRITTLLLCGFCLSACVVGQQLKLDSTPQSIEAVGKGEPVRVEVQDLREDVVNGKQKPWVVGQYRAGLGNPWKVTTEGNVPLNLQLTTDLKEELASLGFTEGTAGKTLQVLVNAWDFTGYQNGRFWYELVINALSSAGTLIVSDTQGKEIEVKGTLLLGARGGFERDMPEIYARIVASVVRDNPQVLDALSD